MHTYMHTLKLFCLSQKTIKADFDYNRV